jgi:hypothetical protein
VTRPRTCQRATCGDRPVATLTFVYADSTAVLGPLTPRPEPFAYDLCPHHAERLTPPRGWEVIRLEPQTVPLAPSGEDLAALADSVRQRGRHALAVGAFEPAGEPAHSAHLSLVRGERDAIPLK